MMTRLSIASCLFLAGCSCSGAATQGGPTPYVRCAMAEPAAIDRTIGSLHVHSDERVLVVEGAESPLRLAVFRGPALAEEATEPALDAIEATRPAVAVLLGSVGDDARIDATIAALAQVAIPTLVVLGGRDHQEDVTRAIAAVGADAPGMIVDASAFRAVRIAGVELVPIAGAPDGRYARDEHACGLGQGDVDAIVSDLGAASSPRFAIGFAAPSALPGIEGAEAGSALVADLFARASITAGLFAWPDVPTARPDAPSMDARIVVPPLLGPGPVLTDGSRASSGPLLVEVSPQGLRVPSAAP